MTVDREGHSDTQGVIIDIVDTVYGACCIGEPLLHDLLHTRAVARLRGVHQAGASFLVRDRRDVSRYDHAAGVMLLIRLLGGSVEEQAAGLIHDVSHTAFSHVVDHVFDNRDEDHHEQLYVQLVMRSDIPAVLGRHGAVLEPVLQSDRWSLLEQPMPELSADRIDYTLRDLLRMGWISPAEVRAFLDAVVVHDGRIVVADLEAALWFTRQFHRAVIGLYMDPLETFANATLGRAIRLALDRGIIHPSDLLLEDDQLLMCMAPTRDPSVRNLLRDLGLGNRTDDDVERHELRAFSKARYIDPLVLIAPDRTVRCSQLDPAVNDLHEEVLRKAREGITVRIVA